MHKSLENAGGTFFDRKQSEESGIDIDPTMRKRQV